MNKIKNAQFWLVILLIAVAIAVVLILYPHSSSPITIGHNNVYHWIGWSGALYIAAATLVYYVIRRRYVNSYQNIMKFHIFGNLIAFITVSIHFTHQIGSPPILGTYTHLGLTMYSALSLQVITGVLLRFQFINKLKSVRFIHVALVMTFYLILIIHILHGLNII